LQVVEDHHHGAGRGGDRLHRAIDHRADVAADPNGKVAGPATRR